ncbi:MAG: hypothetical protein ACREUK_09500, partial [Burkholderiales bacterium]
LLPEMIQVRLGLHPLAKEGRLARQNYQFEKRQRDLAKKQKQEEKRLRKQQRAQPQPSELAPGEPPAGPPAGEEDPA